MNQKLYVLKGLPGSGKSTLAQSIIRDAKEAGLTAQHFEADMFFSYDNSYTYVSDLIKDAHAWCYTNVLKALLINKTQVVVVSNTFTRKWEYQKYIDVCNANDIEYEVKSPSTDWAWDVDECYKRNTHKVSREVIQKMKDRFEL